MIRRRPTLLRLIFALAISVTLAAAGMSNAQADAYSTKLIDATAGGFSNLPCDDVIYPVIFSNNPYVVNAADPIPLNPGVWTALTSSNTASSSDTIAVTDTRTTSFGFGLNFGSATNFGTGSLTFTSTYSTTHTNGQTHDFSVSQGISLDALRSGMTATPVYYRTQQWGDYYSCDQTTKAVTRHTSNDIYNDVTLSQGWLLSCADNQACVAGRDFQSR
jgi:hypothetical protein